MRPLFSLPLQKSSHSHSYIARRMLTTITTASATAAATAAAAAAAAATTTTTTITTTTTTMMSPIRSVILRVINKIGRPHSESLICLVTSVTTDRFGRHEVRLPINHSYNKLVIF